MNKINMNLNLNNRAKQNVNTVSPDTFSLKVTQSSQNRKLTHSSNEAGYSKSREKSTLTLDKTNRRLCHTIEIQSDDFKEFGLSLITT